jgi:hypothetical protein
VFKKFTLVGGDGDGKEAIINMNQIVSMNETKDGNTILVSTARLGNQGNTHVAFEVNESLNKVFSRIC